MRYPYHRYLTYQVLNGDAVDDIIDHMVDLEYAAPDEGDVQELVNHLRRRRVTKEIRIRYGVDFFDGEGMDKVHWIVETPAARTVAERMLLDRVAPKAIATVLELKFGATVAAVTVERFRDGFWDTATLTAVDFSNYFRLAGGRKPDPQPTSLVTRPAMAAWKEGLVPDEEELSPDAIVREIQVDAFMRYKQMAAVDDHKTAMDWAKLALKTAPARRLIAESKLGSQVPALKEQLFYPEHKVATLGDLHSEYSEIHSGTGSVSEAAGRREGDDETPA
jgi:hypothetical protein